MLPSYKIIEFFKHVSDDNPMVKDVHKNIINTKKNLSYGNPKTLIKET
jgi:hypothetical protein